MNALCRIITQSAGQSGHKIFRVAGKKGPASSVLNACKPGSYFLNGDHVPEWNSCRYSYTFLSRVTAEQLWKGVTSVSPAGKKKGRGKGLGRKRMHDLNRGQVIGFGKKNMLWPGLNSPVIRGKEVLTQQELPPDETREKRILEMRDQFSRQTRFKLHALERGWSGTSLQGRTIGPPDPIGEETFEGFDSRVIEYKTVMKMSGQRGRVRSLSAFVVVGNKKGLAGFALSKSANGSTAASNAKNKAALNLRFIERYKNHTVYHDFHTTFGAVRIFVYKKSEGYGLVCHRAIKCICEMIGITDLYAKVEGPSGNVQNITKAFFIGLMKQKLPHQLAEEKGLHLVELRKQRDDYPELIASPSRCRTADEIDIHETMDFKLYIFDGKVPEKKEPYVPYYHKFDTYIKEMKDREKQRNQRDVRIHLLARYGGLKSFLTVRYEEAAKKAIKDSVESEE